MMPPLAALDSGWSLVLIGSCSAIAGAGVWLWERWRASRAAAKAEGAAEATAPAQELKVSSQAAETIAAAAASLIQPFQVTVTNQQAEITRLQEGLKLSRAAEEACKHELDAVRTELASVKAKVTEVTEHLDLEPPDGDPPDHPRRRRTDR